MHCVVARLYASFSVVSFKKVHQLSCSNGTFVNLRSYMHNRQRRCFSHVSSGESFDPADRKISETDEFDFESQDDVTEEVDFDKIAGGNAALVKFLKITQLEMEMMRQNGQKAPKRLTPVHWERLLAMQDSKTQRLRYIQYLWLNETKKQHRRERQMIASKIREERKRQIVEQEQVKLTTSSPMVYGLSHVTTFHRLYDTQINRYYNYKLLLAAWFGPHIVFDCDYERYMSEKDLSLTVKQMLLSWSENRDHLNPAHLLFCNVNPNGDTKRRLQRLFPTCDDSDFPLFLTEKHYLDVYPKEKLVYLTPHCTEVLTEYNPDDVYIIGALVDQSKSNPLSLAKAKKEGLRKAKLPIDQFVHWGVGTKSLTLNHCLGILNDVKDGCSWTNAFIRHLPRRKVLGEKFSYQVSDDKNGTYNTAKSIREQYRRNLVFDLVMQQRIKKDNKKDDANIGKTDNTNIDLVSSS